MGEKSMSKIWKPKDPGLLKLWVQTILDEASDELNDWESNFIIDIQNRLERGYTLTETQEEKLEQIYAEKTA